jgi:hypothetical protein
MEYLLKNNFNRLEGSYMYNKIYNMKKCYKCQTSKSLELFSKNKRYKDGRNDVCKACKKSHKNHKINKEYQEKNKEKISNYSKIYYSENKEKIKEYMASYNVKNFEEKKLYASKYWVDNKTKIKEYIKNWKEENPSYYKEYMSGKYNSDINFKLKSNLRSRFNNALNTNAKSSSVIKLLGCSIEDLKLYLKSKFYGEMTMDNHGSYWEIDHILPCSMFNLSKPNEQEKCFHYTNLQPLTKLENRIKGSKLCGANLQFS